MRTVLLVGIGTGHPDHITVMGVAALNRADALFIPTKGEEKAALAALRRQICARHVAGSPRLVEFALPLRDAANPSYAAGVEDWHEAIAARYETLLLEQLGPEQSAALLVWGDPGLYDSTLRILKKVRARGRVEFAVEMVPGITAIQALCAAFAIPLNRVGEAVTVTTGRNLAQGWPQGATSVVVMLDGQEAFRKLAAPGIRIHWGAYLGSPEQILLSGPLAEMAGEIARARAEARARHGWIMDTYLLVRE